MSGGSGGRGGRRPDPAVDAAIRKATLELLVERGFDLTFDEVAERAGVGRTSVFRRYPTKEALLTAVGEQVTIDRMEAPDTGSLDGDLAAAVEMIFGVFSRPEIEALARQSLVAAYRRQEGAFVLRSLLARRTELVTRVLERAAERGEIADAGRAPLVADLVTGVIMARLAVDGGLPRGEEAGAVARALGAAART